jgi:hypothetical protein
MENKKWKIKDRKSKMENPPLLCFPFTPHAEKHKDTA